MILFCILAEVCMVNATIIHNRQQEVQERSSSPKPAKAPQFKIDDHPIALFFKTLGFVIILALILYLFLRVYRALTFGNGLSRRSPQIRILSSSAIGPKKSLCLVNVLDNLLLLGITDGQISVLLQVPSKELNEDLRDALLKPYGNSETNFRKLFNNLLKK